MTPRTASQEQRGAATQELPVVKVSAQCPNCGRANVVVFQVTPSANSKPDEKPQLVCLACCPKVPSNS